MTVRELEYRGQWERIVFTFLVATLLWFHFGAQAADDRANNQQLLSPISTLAGGRVTAKPNPASHQSALAGYLSWWLPTAVAVRGNYMYVVDGGRRQIFQFDLARQTMTPFAEFSAGTVSSITVAPDLSLYVADINARQVFHFSVDGRLLQTFDDNFEVARPVAVSLDEASGRIWVADSMYNHVVVFNSLGRVLSVLQSPAVRSIAAMALGTDGLYLIDRLSRQVVVLGQDGTNLYTLGQDTLKDPGAIAVDRFNRVFVSDSFDNKIKVYERGQLVASVGGSGATPAALNRITGLWIEQNVLYVVDSLNARIQTFFVAPPRVNERSHDQRLQTR